ncbi:hypothetical protein NDU88_006232 [Pleurodeles waltl]|uniref:Uncharacterized protein n=1 Tax=Pleurodeles waltl TaxID=8319 RepID=A0AAV7UKD9_PLEWA|nr:hypothetical protein NDU88_006232 [Pleurodeles waltl]
MFFSGSQTHQKSPLDWRRCSSRAPRRTGNKRNGDMGNPHIRVPWGVSVVTVAMAFGCGVAYATESGHRSRFCDARSRNIR